MALSSKTFVEGLRLQLRRFDPEDDEIQAETLYEEIELAELQAKCGPRRLS